MDQIEQLAVDLHSVAIHLLRRVREADTSLGVTPARLSALSVLVVGGPRTLSQLADAEHVAGPTMSKIVAALERGGLVRRDPDSHDRRAIRLSATPDGRRLMLRGRHQRVERLVRELRHLSTAEQTTVREAVTILLWRPSRSRGSSPSLVGGLARGPRERSRRGSVP